MSHIQLIATINNDDAIPLESLVCTVTINNQKMNYTVYIDKKTAKKLDSLLLDKPFKQMRISPNVGADLVYDSICVTHTIDVDGLIDSSKSIAKVYLRLCLGKSRKKYRLDIPYLIAKQFHWLAHLESHENNHAKTIIDS